MTALATHSLVQRTEDIEGASRYVMLETVREFAQEQLEGSNEAAATRQRHAEHFVRLAEEAEPVLTSPHRKPWLKRLEANQQNLRGALAWLVQERKDGSAGLRLAAALPWMWYFAGHYLEGRDWLREALALDGAGHDSVARARALSGAARLATFVGEMGEASVLAEQSVHLWRGSHDRRGLGLALFHLAIPAMFVSGREHAVAILHDSLNCFCEVDDAWGIALATTYTGVVLAFAPGSENEARAALTEGRARFIALGDEWGASTAPGYLAAIAMRAGQFDAAREIVEPLLELLIRLGDTFRIARGLHQLAEISLAQGRLPEATERLCASLALNREQHRIGDAIQQLRLLARLECMQHRPARAVRLFAMALRTDVPGSTLPPDDLQLSRGSLDAARDALGERDFEAEWILGSVMTFEQASDWALSGDALIGDRGAIPRRVPARTPGV